MIIGKLYKCIVDDFEVATDLSGNNFIVVNKDDILFPIKVSPDGMYKCIYGSKIIYTFYFKDCLFEEAI